VLLFGAMAAFALSEYRFKRQHADGALSGARHHDPDPLGTIGILQGWWRAGWSTR
jgi:hypothetical protein